MPMLPKYSDVDHHITEPPDFWNGRIPKKFVERASKFHVNIPTLGPGWSWDGGKTVRPMGRGVGGGEDPRKIANFKMFEEIDHGCYDAKARLRVMDVDGAQAALLFPNAGGRFHEMYPDDFYLACTQGYNDASIDWPASADPNLVMSVHGFGGGRVPPAARAVATDAGTTGTSRANVNTKGTAQMGGRAQELTAASQGAGLGCTPALAAFIFSGALERNPKLKVSLIETSIGWLPYFAEQMDALWLQQRHVMGAQLKNLPSESLANIYASFDRGWLAVKCRDWHVGTNKVTFATDYPHIGAFHPHSRFYMELLFIDVSGADQEKILWSNAAKVYGVNQPPRNPSEKREPGTCRALFRFVLVWISSRCQPWGWRWRLRQGSGCGSFPLGAPRRSCR